MNEMKPLKTILKIKFAVLVMLFSNLVMSTEMDSKKHQLENAIKQFSSAFQTADIQSLQQMLTDNYFHINGSSGKVIDKQAWLAWNKSRVVDIASKKEIIESYVVEDLRIEMFENTAMVTGIVKSKGIRNGKKFDSKIRISNVWVFTNNQWKRAAFHDSAME